MTWYFFFSIIKLLSVWRYYLSPERLDERKKEKRIKRKKKEKREKK